jgi:hypothetical protein
MVARRFGICGIQRLSKRRPLRFYAFFPSPRRLAIEQSRNVTVYDSGDQQISGVSQQQGSGHSFAFTSQRGDVKVDELKKV